MARNLHKVKTMKHVWQDETMMDEIVVTRTKKCNKCKEELPISEFWVNCSRCILCMKKYHDIYRKLEIHSKIASQKSAQWAKNHPEKNKQHRRKCLLKRYYNITPAEYDKMLQEQRGVCKICSRKMSDGKNLSVDHDHSNGRIRGLLCPRCNTWLGYIEKNPNIDKKLHDFLRKFKKGLDKKT